MATRDQTKKPAGTGERERAIDRLEKDVEDLRQFAGTADADAELERLRREVGELRREFYTHLGPWQRAQIARHPQRPYTQDLIGLLFTDFIELHGDRGYGDDKAIVAGLARFHGRPVAVVGHQKGRDTKQRLARNFGQPKPEGYRKALRVMELAAKYGKPIFTFIDTQGAYPGLDAEERGQAEAIARNLREMARLPVPIIVTVTGEGGSGGALAIAACNTVLMLEHAIYTVASPEAAASILWRDSSRAQEAATGMKITDQDLIKFGIIDGIIPEPLGGAHRDPAATIASAGRALSDALKSLHNLGPDELRNARAEKFLAMGRKI
jgi:acetyl-CoA carboxylase carboxyl transferase subunit alpha